MNYQDQRNRLEEALRVIGDDCRELDRIRTMISSKIVEIDVKIHLQSFGWRGDRSLS